MDMQCDKLRIIHETQHVRYMFGISVIDRDRSAISFRTTKSPYISGVKLKGMQQHVQAYAGRTKLIFQTR
jgi:hypothetical protein